LVFFQFLARRQPILRYCVRGGRRQNRALRLPSNSQCVRNDFALFAGNASAKLAASLARELGARLGNCAVERFPDGEVDVRLLESVRRRDVFLVQSTSPPVNDHLMELLAMADACRRAAAARITAVIPYFGYARADKRRGRGEPITARVVADLLETVGVAHVVTLDPHTPQIEGFFHAPVDTLTAVPALCEALRESLPKDVVVVSPDAGRANLAAHYARCLGAPVVVLHKRRSGGDDVEVTHVVGDVSGKACVIIDDVISTAGTMAKSIRVLLDKGARPDILIAATHGLFMDRARERLDALPVREILVTDTVEPRERDWKKLRVVSSAPLLGAALRRFVS
jgi:ribose-phosphate pyrophosphokinase